MAAPASAASAFHRRRLISNASPTGLATAQHPAAPNQLPAQQVLATARAPSTHHRYSQHQHRSVPVQSSFSVPAFAYSLISPLLSFAHTTLPQVAAATLVSLFLAHLLRSLLISTVGSVFLSCPARPPALPAAVSLVNLLLLAPLILFVLVSHYLLFRAATSKQSFPLHCVTSFFTTPPLAILFSYLIYGPFLSPHQFFCTVPASIMPSYRMITAPIFAAAFAAPGLTYLTFRLRPHTPPPYPFPRSVLSRAFSAFPPALLVASLSTLPALIPTLLYTLVSRPQRSFYPSLLLTLSRSLSAAFATAAALLPHSLLLTFHPQSDAPLSTPPVPFAVQDARQTLANAPNEPPRDVRAAVTTLTSHPVNLHPFPPFSDPSGRVWRATMDAALTPINSLAERLRGMYMSESPQQHGLYPDARYDPASGQPNGTLVTPQYVTLDSVTSLPFDEIMDSLAALRYLPGLFAASREHDSYGVAHPTLPHALAILLVLRERALAALEYDPNDRRALEWFSWLPPALRPTPATAALSAIIDAVTVCIYRFTDMFREQAVVYVEGREIGWDASLSPALASFLSFST